jgi:transcriptional regulator with XRE-family HTH domain
MVGQVRQAIQDSPLSLLELGQRSGVNQSQLSRFVRGERGLTLAAAAKVCEVLGLGLAWQGGAAPPSRPTPRPGPGRPPKQAPPPDAPGKGRQRGRKAKG